jgi:signal transduction histidine kinase
MVLGMVQRGCGHIEVESEPGNGTAFSVYLPLDEQ